MDGLLFFDVFNKNETGNGKYVKKRQQPQQTPTSCEYLKKYMKIPHVCHLK